jgi:hypothetical protein
MRRAVVVGWGVLVLAVGCGAGAGDDATLKEQIDLMNQVAADYEKVTDAASWKKVQADLDKLKERADELRRKEASWTDVKKKELGDKYEAELNAATERLVKAREAAQKRARHTGEAP